MNTAALRILFGLALIGHWGVGVRAAPIVAPLLPAAATVQPIALTPGGSESIALGSVIFRIATGTAIGGIYKIGQDKAIREQRWEIALGRTHEFDVAIMDRLRQFGYAIVDASQSAFDTVEPTKAKYQLGAIVSRAHRDFFFRYRGGIFPDDGYGIADLDVEFQILDQATAEIIFRKMYTGYGTEVGKDPRPLTPAFLNALDHALTDPAFVDKLRKPTTLISTAASNRPVTALRVPACPATAGTRLPDDVGRIIPAVVTLRIGRVSGTGIIVSPQGHLLTAAHLVTGATGVTATLPNGMEFDATVLRVDASIDLAILQLPGRGHPCAPVSAPMALKVGEDVFVVGSPLGKTLASSVSRGVLSGVRTIEGVQYLQTDASVSPGNSGGPMFDARGRVQAIVSTKIAAPGVEGLAFGVPVDLFAEHMAVVFD